MAVQVPVTDPATQLKLPPGFRFHPTDEELMLQYLHPKLAGHNFPLRIIGDIDLYKFDPWELPSKAMYGDKEWYFFSRRHRKYSNGSRLNRVAGSGSWKATGREKMIMADGRVVGIKKTLVFYVSRAAIGSKTNWIMHEYMLSEPSAKDDTSRLDDWVLCRIYKKNSSAEERVSGSPTTDQSYGSPLSSSQLDDILYPFSAINDQFLNIPINNSENTFIEEDQKVNIQNFDSGNYHWMSVDQIGLEDPMSINNTTNCPNLSSVDPTFNMQSSEIEIHPGIRSQRRENSGYLYSQSFVNENDPFAIRYPTQQGSSSYTQ